MERTRKQPPPSDDASEHDPPEAAPEVLERVQLSANRCPYCHTAVTPDEVDWLACAGCLARHHTACWSESGRCGACGGEAQLERRPPGAARGRSWFRSAWFWVPALVLILAALLPASWIDGELGPSPVGASFVPGGAALGVQTVSSVEQSGARIHKLHIGGPAHAAGLRDGDVIQSINGKPVADPEDLRVRLDGHRIGDVVSVGVTRWFNEQLVREVELVGRTPEATRSAKEASALLFDRLGARIEDAFDGEGARVTEVLAGTLAGESKLRQHDIIQSVNGVACNDVAQLEALLSGTSGAVRLGIRRSYGESRVIEVALPD